MKQFVLLLLIFSGLVEFSYAQTENAVLWQRKSGPSGGAIYDIEVDATSGKTYAIAGNDRRLYYSVNDGDTWEEIYPSQSFHYFNDIEITNNTVYLSADYGIWSTPTTSLSWTELTSNYYVWGSANKIKRLSTGRLVVLGNSGIFYSTDEGASWSQVSLTGAINRGYLTKTSANQLFLIKDQKIYRSNDLGATFLEFAAGLTTYQAHSVWSNNDGSNIYLVTSDNIYISDGTANWSSIKAGSISDITISTTTTQASLLEFSADGLGMFFIDNNNHKVHAKAVSGASSTWALRQTVFPSATTTISNATSRSFPTAATSTILFGSKLGVYKTTNGVTTYSLSNANIDAVQANSLTYDANSGSLLMVAESNSMILKSTNEGDTWSTITGFTGQVYQLTQNTNRSILYLATNNGALRSTDGGANWTSLSLPSSVFLERFLPADGNKVFAVSGNTIYYSPSSGTTGTWVTVAVSGLPLGSGYGLSSDYIKCANANRIILRLYDYNTSSYKLYKILISYGVGNAISSAAATEITNSTFPANNVYRMFAANGNFILYNVNTSPNSIAVSSDFGGNWTVSTLSGSSNVQVTHNGYIFSGSNSNAAKVYLSRNNGTSFQETTFDDPQPQTYNLEDVVIDNSGNAYLGFDGDFVYRSKKSVVLPDAVPANLTEVGKVGTAVALRWDDNSSNENNFEIFQSTNGVDFVKSGEADDYCVTPTDRDFFVATGLLPNTNYTFRVRAANDAGSSSTTQLAVTTGNSCAQTIPDNRSWSAVNTGPSGYAIVTPKTVNIKHIAGGKYEVSDISLGIFGSSADPGTFFESCGQTFVVESGDVKSNGNGTWNGTNTLTLKWRACSSDEFEVINFTLNSSDPAPTAPTVRAYNLSNNSIEVNWTAGSYDRTYVIERSTNPSSGFVAITGSPVTYPVTKIVDNTGLVAGTTYYYRVKSRNANTTPIESAYSANAVITFGNPKFVVAGNAVSNYEAVSLGSYWGDFNNDGLEDFFTLSFDPTTEKGVPLIFKNNGGGNFTIAPTSGIEGEAYFISTVIDYDNDGTQDLAFTGQSDQLLDLYKGNGDFTFTKVTSTSGALASVISEDVDLRAMSWGDMNDDGLLDLAVSGEISSGGTGKTLLYLQNNDHTFSKISGGSSLSADVGVSSGVAWADYNNDGLQDFLVINSEGAFRLYENLGNNTFEKKTGIGLNATSALTACWGDYNNDGYMDLYVGTSTLNALYKNNGNETFSLEGATTIAEASTNTSAAWGDYNNDGYLDLLTGSFINGQTRLFLRDASSPGTLTFIKYINEKINDLSISHYGVASADYDLDGHLDLALSSFKFTETNDGIATTNIGLFKNNTTTGNWTEIKLAPTSGNKSGIGAVIKVTAGGVTQTREIQAYTTFVSKSSTIAHFGIGSNATISNIQVKWANGNVQNYPNAPINQLLTIDQDLVAPSPTVLSPAHNATNISPVTQISITLDQASSVVAGKFLMVYLNTNLSSPVFGIDMANAVKNGNEFAFVLPQQLLPGTKYNVGVDAGAFIDKYGNASAEMPTGLWSFTTATAPVTTALLPIHNALNVPVNSAIQLTFDRNISAISGKRLKIMDGATAVVDIDVSSVGTVTNNIYVYTPTSPLPNNKLLKVLVDAGAFVDASKQSPFAGIVSDGWNFTTVISADLIPPTITFTPPATAAKGFGSMASPEITVTDDRGTVSSVVISIKKLTAASTTFVEVPATQGTGANSNKWVFSISEANHFDAIGTEYFITAKDPANNISRSPEGTATNKLYLTYSANESKIPSDKLGFGGAVSNWKVFSIPFELGVNNSFTSIFNELDGKENKVDFRFLTIQPNANTNWTEYPSFTTINRGQGYFSNIKTPVDVLLGALQAPENSRTNLFTINLKAGWNMVGNPYLTQISWANVKDFNGLTGQIAELHKFNGSTYPVNVQTLDPYEGGFVFAQSDKTVTIPFLNQIASGGRHKYEELGDDINAPSWLLHLIVKQGDVTNELGSIGMAPDAKAGLDDYDGVTPPRFIQYLETSFAHPESFAKRFARDVVTTQSEYTWNLTVASNLEGDAEIVWNNANLSAGAKEIFLLDVARQRLIDMRTASSYTFNPKETTNFKIYFGDNLKIAPQAIVLGKAFPNPTSGFTNIGFSLPDSGGQNQFVSLEILDATGRQVGTVLQGKYQPGFHEAGFNAKELNNGFYTYRLTVHNATGHHTQVSKLIIK